MARLEGWHAQPERWPEGEPLPGTAEAAQQEGYRTGWQVGRAEGERQGEAMRRELLVFLRDAPVIILDRAAIAALGSAGAAYAALLAAWGPKVKAVLRREGMATPPEGNAGAP